MATAPMIVNLETAGEDLARKTVFVKLHLGVLSNSRKVSSSQVEVDADKRLVEVSKTPLDSPDLEAVRRLDGEIRRYLYGVCLPFEPGIHLLPIPLIETVGASLRRVPLMSFHNVGSGLESGRTHCRRAEAIPQGGSSKRGSRKRKMFTKGEKAS